MATLTINDRQLASAFYAGYGEEGEVFGDKIKSWVNGAINFGQAAWSKAKTLGDNFFKKIAGFKFSDWLEEDPLGAVAGAGAILLAGCVIVGVGLAAGAAIGGVSTALGAAYTAGGWLAVGKTVVGGIWGLIKARGLTLAATGVIGGWLAPKMFRFFVRAKNYLWNFNLNTTDAQLDAQHQGAITGWYGVLGDALGTAMGGIICGNVAGALAVKFNPRAIVHVKEQLGDDIYEEIVSSLWGLVNTSKQVVVGWLTRNAFKYGRRLIKWLVRNSFWLTTILGEDRAKTIAKWGEPGSESFTFAEKYENAIDNISDPNKRAFLENFGDTFSDTCDEAVLVVASAMEASYP